MEPPPFGRIALALTHCNQIEYLGEDTRHSIGNPTATRPRPQQQDTTALALQANILFFATFRSPLSKMHKPHTMSARNYSVHKIVLP